ncbi:hypothetical protein [Synechococcus sp. CS-1326]|uniref:hypothetical protein n=1 Tax=Synechococcus sp. CS-1326 TaxID=2847978 RepID=UPI00223B7AA4|nr:hypothetical protein [Synechococcus sp. CS-1326]
MNTLEQLEMSKDSLVNVWSHLAGWRKWRKLLNHENSHEQPNPKPIADERSLLSNELPSPNRPLKSRWAGDPTEVAGEGRGEMKHLWHPA